MMPIVKIALGLGGSLIAGLLLVFPWWYWSDSLPATGEPDEMPARSLLHESPALFPLPNAVSLPPEKVALGEQLFHDPRLSRDGSIACASCHDLAKGGTDQAYRSKGINGAMGTLNTPTVFNSGFNFRQFWDGRAASLEDQIDGPVQHPGEMGSAWPDVVARLAHDDRYRASFRSLYPGQGLTRDSIKDAIATYERSLVTPNSRFDRYLAGDRAALAPDEARGYRLFVDNGCVACHQGVALGGNLYQTLGIVGNYFEDHAGEAESRAAHFGVPAHDHTKHPHRVKVPSLRNIALTAPYFHDGSARTLEDAVRIMGEYQLGRTLSDQDIRMLTAFLRTLTGTYRGAPL